MKKSKFLTALLTAALTVTLALPASMPAQAAGSTAIRRLFTMTMNYPAYNYKTAIQMSYYNNGDVKSLAQSEIPIKEDSDNSYKESSLLKLREDGSVSTFTCNATIKETFNKITESYNAYKRLTKITSTQTRSDESRKNEIQFTYTGSSAYPVSGSNTFYKNGEIVTDSSYTFSDFKLSDDQETITYKSTCMADGKVTTRTTEIDEFKYSDDCRTAYGKTSLAIPNQYFESLAKSTDQNYVERDEQTGRLTSMIYHDRASGDYQKDYDFTYNSDGEMISCKMASLNSYTDEPKELGTIKCSYLTFTKTAQYKVVSSATAKKAGTVTYFNPLNKTKTAAIPETVTINGLKYKVTAVAANAFKNNRTLTRVTIGKNVKKIGARAFYNCGKLKKVIIKSKKLTKKTVGKNAFSKINKKAKVKVPANKLKAYRKLLKTKGVKKSTQKITR